MALLYQRTNYILVVLLYLQSSAYCLLGSNFVTQCLAFFLAPIVNLPRIHMRRNNTIWVEGCCYSWSQRLRNFSSRDDTCALGSGGECVCINGTNWNTAAGRSGLYGVLLLAGKLDWPVKRDGPGTCAFSAQISSWWIVSRNRTPRGVYLMFNALYD